MSSEIPPEKRAAALYDRLYAAFNDGLELIAIQAGYRFGWYSALAQHGPCTANQPGTVQDSPRRSRRDPERVRLHAMNQLQRLGYHVTLSPAAAST
jgi:hypothetical protein